MARDIKSALELSDSDVNIAIKMANQKEFGVISSDFISRSIGVLNPKAPICVKESDSLASVLALLKQYSMGSVLVTNDQGVLVGIFTERDSLLKVMGAELDPGTLVSSVMTHNPQSQKLDGTIAFALNLMSLGGFRHIPIVDDDNMPIGIISVKDVVDYLVGKMNEDIFNLEVGAL